MIECTKTNHTSRRKEYQLDEEKKVLEEIFSSP